MPICKNDPKKKYKGDEPSPKGIGWCAHSEKQGKIRKGQDGNKWIVKKVSSGSLRWMKHTNGKSNSNKTVSKKIIKKTKKSIKVKKAIVKKTNNKKMNCSKFVVYRRNTKSFFSTKNEILVGLACSKDTIYKFISYNKFEKTPSEIPDGFRKSKVTSSLIKSYCGSR